MYAKVVQICIFAYLIFISEGLPQDYHHSALPENEPPDMHAEGRMSTHDGDNADDAALDYEPQDENVGDAGGYDDAGLDHGSEDAKGENLPAGNGYDYDDNDDEGGYDDAGPDYGPAGANDYDPPDDEGGYDDVRPNYGHAGGQDYGPQSANVAGEYDEGEYYYNNSESEYQDEYPEFGEPISQLKFQPGSSEILNRNKPEPGFDLSNDEMKKLKLWPDALIPYYIDVHSFNDKVMRDKIRSFLSSVNSLTSLNFVELPSPPSDSMRWVFFINRRGLLGCADHSIRNFTNSGVQQVVLGYHCMSTEGELAEAVLSIAGVPAQHNSPDRDYYIKIKEENIIPEKKYLFEKRSDDEWLFHDLEYDFKSAGHFHSYKHSINGRATILPQTKPEDVTLGESKTLSAGDILKIRMLYNYIVKKKLLQAPDCHKLFEPGKKFGQYKPSDINLKPRSKPFRYTGESSDAPLEEDDIVPDDVQNDEDGYNKEFTVAVPNENINDGDNNDLDYEMPAENEGQGDNQTPNENANMLEENEVVNDDGYADEDYVDDGYADEEPTPDYNYNYNDPGNENNDLPKPQEEEESDNYSPTDFHAENKPTIINIGQGPINSNTGSKLQLKDIEYSPNDNNNYHMHHALSLKSPQMTKTLKTEDLLAALSDFKTGDEDDMWAKERTDINKYSFIEKHPKRNLKFRGID